MSKTALKNPIELFNESAKAVKRNLSLFIFLNIVTILGAAWDIGLDLRDKTKGSGWGQVFVHQFVGTSNSASISAGLILLLVLVGIPLYFMAVVLSVKAASQRTVELKDVWQTFIAKWWKILLVLVLVVAIICVGLLLLIIPGLYLMSRLWLAPYLVIDRDVGVKEALNQTWELTKGKAWTVFIAIFFGALLSLTSIVPVVGPVLATALTIAYSVALPTRYFELKKLKQQNAQSRS